MAERKVVIDFGLWGALTAPSLPRDRGPARRRARCGFKAFMPISDPSYPHVDRRRVPGRHARGRRRSAGWCWCTPRATRCCRPASPGCRPRAARDPLAHHESRPAVRRGGGRPPRALPRRPRRRADPDRARVEPGQRRARAAARRRAGRPATMEICPHHLLLDLDDLVRLGPYGVCAPALRERDARRAAVGRTCSTAPPTAWSPTTRPTRCDGEGAAAGRTSSTRCSAAR